MHKILIFIGVVAGLMSGAFVQDEETLAIPKYRSPTLYPTVCLPAPGETLQPQTVVVTFSVNRDGQTEDVRVRESSDACFNETAIAAARG